MNLIGFDRNFDHPHINQKDLQYVSAVKFVLTF